MGFTVRVQKVVAKTLMLIDVYRVKRSSVVYLTDTSGKKIYCMIEDVPLLIEKLAEVYQEAKEDGKT